MTDRKLQVKEIAKFRYAKRFLEDFYAKFGNDITKVSLLDILSRDSYHFPLTAIVSLIDEDIFIASGSVQYCYEFAKDMVGADIERLQEVIITSGDPKYCYLFARFVKGANTARLLEVIIVNNSRKYYCLFICDVKGADVRKLQKAVAASGDPEYIKYFNACFKRVNNIRLQEL